MEKIFEEGTASFYVRGDVIDTSQDTHYIKSGSVALYSSDGESRSFLFAHKTGEIFPYFDDKDSLMSGRKLEYRALSSVSLLSIPTPEFEAVAAQPENSKLLIGNLKQIMEVQVERIDNLEQGQVYERLLERLNFFAKRLGVKHGDKIVIESPMSHADIASSIGTSRETVNRFMKRLEKAGVISIRKQVIIINSSAALDRMIAQRAGGGSKGSIVMVILITSVMLNSVLAAFFMHSRRNQHYRGDALRPVNYSLIIQR